MAKFDFNLVGWTGQTYKTLTGFVVCKSRKDVLKTVQKDYDLSRLADIKITRATPSKYSSCVLFGDVMPIHK